MHFILQPWHLFVLAVANMINHEQSKIIEYLKVENRVLREQLLQRGGRIRFTDRQRRRLAAAAKSLGRNALRKLETIVTPDTLLRWREAVLKTTNQTFYGIGSWLPRSTTAARSVVVSADPKSCKRSRDS